MCTLNLSGGRVGRLENEQVLPKSEPYAARMTLYDVLLIRLSGEKRLLSFIHTMPGILTRNEKSRDSS